MTVLKQESQSIRRVVVSDPSLAVALFPSGTFTVET